MTELIDMPNVGLALASNLRAAGIETADDLIRAGSRQAFIRIRQTADPSACLHVLYGLEGAVQGIRDSQLTAGTKAALRAFFHDLEHPQRDR